MRMRRFVLPLLLLLPGLIKAPLLLGGQQQLCSCSEEHVSRVCLSFLCIEDLHCRIGGFCWCCWWSALITTCIFINSSLAQALRHTFSFLFFSCFLFCSRTHTRVIPFAQLSSLLSSRLSHKFCRCCCLHPKSSPCKGLQSHLSLHLITYSLVRVPLSIVCLPCLWSVQLLRISSSSSFFALGSFSSSSPPFSHSSLAAVLVVLSLPFISEFAN